jgi:hypothetical protein
MNIEGFISTKAVGSPNRSLYCAFGKMRGYALCFIGSMWVFKEVIGALYAGLYALVIPDKIEYAKTGGHKHHR